MIEKEVLQYFIDLKNPDNKKWLDLIRASIHFTPKEKAMFIIDFRYYKPEQIEKFILVLEKSEKNNKELKEKHSKEYNKRIEWFKIGWENMIDYLEEVLVENKIKDEKKLDDNQISDLREKIKNNF